MGEFKTVFDKPIRMTMIESWTPEEVREMCIRHDWYTRGDCKAYDAMLQMVIDLVPSPVNMFRVAKDIANHSGDKYDNEDGSSSVQMILFCIANETVTREFDL